MSDRVPTPWIEVLAVVAISLVLILSLSGCRAHCKLAETRCRAERVEICDSRGQWSLGQDCQRTSEQSGTLFVCDRLDDGRNTCLPVEP